MATGNTLFPFIELTIKILDVFIGAGNGSSGGTGLSLLLFRCSSRLVPHSKYRCILFYLYFGVRLADELYPLAERDFAFSNLNLSYIPHYLFLLH